MDRIHKELIARGIKHSFTHYDNNSMIISKNESSCSCGWFVTRYMIKKARAIAEQYKENTRRIKALCALFDDSRLDGGAIVYINLDRPIGDRYISLVNAYIDYINPCLISPV